MVVMIVVSVTDITIIPKAETRQKMGIVVIVVIIVPAYEGGEMWKDFERRVARLVGGRRVGPTGQATPDVISDWLRIECKERRALPTWLTDPLSKVRSQTPADALGVVVWHEVHGRDAILVMSFADFVDWFGNPEKERAFGLQGEKLQG